MKVGDIVRITKQDVRWDVHWVVDHVYNKELAICYDVDGTPDEGELATVKTIEYENHYPTWVYIQMSPCCGEEFPPCYIMHISALDVVEEIKVGDSVRITDIGCLYSTYIEWVIKNIKNAELVARFAYSQDIKVGEIYKVHTIAPHEVDRSRLLCYVCDKYGAYYLIGIEGLELVK